MHHKKTGSLLVTILMASLLMISGTSTQTQVARAGVNYDANNVIFQLSNVKDLSAVLKAYNFAAYKDMKIGNTLTYIAKVAAGQDPYAVATTMCRDPKFFGATTPCNDTRLLSAEPNFVASYGKAASNYAYDASNYAFDTTSTITGTSTSTAAAINTASTQTAWTVTNLSTLQARNKGAGVTVAVLDTGVNYNLADFGGKVAKGWNLTGATDGIDVNGHGTFVAGIIHQVAPDANILPVRVLDSTGNGTIDSVVNGANWAKANGAKVINMSFSSYNGSYTMNSLLSDLAASGIVVVCSSGNDNLSNTTYPASNSNVLGVSSTDNTDLKADFSNFGGYVDMSAPGVSIYSIYWQGGYAWANGTSFSTPMVAAGAAIYRSMYPTASYQTVKATIMAAVDAYPATCMINGNPCSNYLGKGRLDFGLIK